MKRMVFMFMLLLSVSFVFAANGWGDINTEDVGDSVSVVDDVSVETVPVVYKDIEVLDADTKYTLNFYIAVGVAIVGVLVAAFFVYLFLRSPKNKWK